MKNTKKAFIVTLIIAIATATFVSCAVRGNDTETPSDTSSKVSTLDNGNETTVPVSDTDDSDTVGTDTLEADTSETTAETTGSQDSEETTAPETEPSKDTSESKPSETKPSETKKEEIKVEVPVVNDTTSASNTTTWEQGEQERQDAVSEYLEDNDIEPDTAGATGETCTRCGKPIWNSHKYGLSNPGDPTNNVSNWCYGSCHILVG